MRHSRLCQGLSSFFLIANTRARGGLKIRAELDTGHYEAGKKASDEELKK
jgi:hypothetical protein